MQPEGAVPPVVGVCYVKSEAEQEPLVSFHVTTSEDMSIFDFLKKYLLPRLKRDSFETLEICQLISNGQRSPTLEHSIMLSELINVR